MTPDPGNMEQFSAEIALGNDLHYSQLVPQVGFHFPIQTNYGEDFAKSWPFLSVFVQSAVFTLGFTPSDRSLVGKMEKLGKTSLQLEQQLVSPAGSGPALSVEMTISGKCWARGGADSSSVSLSVSRPGCQHRASCQSVPPAG